jgi:polyhydroxybutyrate depolymerase
MHALLIPLLLAAAEPVPKHWDVEGLRREALVVTPAVVNAPAPIVFVFHGHGGTARNAARSFVLHTHWPEALVVYPQGVPTPGRLTDPEGKRNGWQHAAGEQGDRDLKFFDAMLASLKRAHDIDETRIYSTGHSNGGGFTYLLWATRPDVFAAVAPSSAGGRSARQVKPLPAMHIAGKADALVRFAGQQRTMDVVRQINGCSDEPTEWAENALLYDSPTGTPFVSVIHPGGHRFYRASVPLMVRFFKEHARKPAEAPGERGASGP